jgi:uncharacterized membrane protein YesL
MEAGGLIGGIYRMLEWVRRFSLTNILWLFVNIPVIYFSFNLLYLKNIYGIVQTIIILLVLLPLLFFPATTALFSVVRLWIADHNDPSIIKSFFYYFKHYYIKSLLGGLMIVPIWGIFLFNFNYYSGKFGALAIMIFIITAMFLFVITCYFFANTVHFEMKLFESLKSSINLCFGNILHTMAIALTVFLIIYVSFFQFTFLIPLCLGTASAYTAFFGYYYSLKHVQNMQGVKKFNV